MKYFVICVCVMSFLMLEVTNKKQKMSKIKRTFKNLAKNYTYDGKL